MILRSKTHRIHGQGGFSLVATLSLLILLLLVAVGLLSLSTITVRTVSQDAAAAEARANARLALMLALGKLQEAAGPDQRITASSGILDTDKSSVEIDGLAANTSSQLLGVWDSWSTWLNAKHKGMKISSTYQDGRHPDLFRRWLVSYSNQTTAESWDAPLSGSSSGFSFVAYEAVNLLGEGSLGEDSEAEEKVYAGLVKVGSKGKLAWWVGPENQKARIGIKNPDLKSKKDILLATDSIGRPAPEVLVGLEAMQKDESAEKHLSTKTLRVAAGIDANQLGKYYAHLSPYSTSLLTDVRHGGMKKDLSLLFERSALPAPMAQTSQWEPGVRPYSPDLLAHDIRRPERTLFSWEQMHEFYRVYRPDAASQGVTAQMLIDGEKPYTNMWTKHALRSGDRTTHNEQGYMRNLVLLRFYANVGLQTERAGGTEENPGYRCYITYTPIITVWNPYNVELRLRPNELNTMSLLYKICPLAYRVYKENVPEGGWRDIEQSYNDYGFGGDWGSNFFKSPGKKGAEMVIPPGGIVLFSHHTQRLGLRNKYQEVFEGFDPSSISKYRARIRGLESVSPATKPGIALRFNRISRRDDYPSWWGGNPGCFMVRMGSPFASYGQTRPGEYSLPFSHNLQFLTVAQGNTHIIPEKTASIARFQFSDSEPVIVGSVGLTAKSGSLPGYDTHISWKKDWRNKTWLHASPGFWGSQMMTPNDRNRAAHPFMLHWKQVGGGAGVAEIVPHIGRYGFVGGGESDGERVSRAPIFELPTAPITSLAGFANLRLVPGWWDEQPLDDGGFQKAHSHWEGRRMGYQSGVPGIGIGNSFADPMLPADEIYQYHDNSKHFTGGNTEGFSDYWDHGFLANDALYDSYFLSSIATEPSYLGSSKSAGTLAEEFFKDGEPLHNSRMIPWIGSADADKVASMVTGDDEAWKKLPAHLMIRGGFNVNSTSLAAWKALFYGLIDRPLVYCKSNGSLAQLTPPTGTAVVTRFHTPQTDKEMDDPAIGVAIDGLNAWSGVRYLTRDHLDLLAEKCVEQVKRRGPFLNMSEFINRRLSDDDLGLAGALQRALDFDDDAPESQSINYRYKIGSYRITESDISGFNYLYPKAATGSRYTAIPGYVTQSDILQALDSTLVVRDDTFRIRGYGESLRPDGTVAARAWCEAVVQRTPDYIDASNANHEPAEKLNAKHEPESNDELTPSNQRYGRRFSIVSFRWLHVDEV